MLAMNEIKSMWLGHAHTHAPELLTNSPLGLCANGLISTVKTQFSAFCLRNHF